VASPFKAGYVCASATVAEVAEMVAFLCSSAAGYVNGASFSMDGGWTAR
jgi:NAD(P)-dependent dehydrogenase (short-subunit alcohol dehydrogenase family)